MTNRTIDNEPSDYSPSDFDPREEAPQVRLSSWLPIDLEPVFRGEYSAPVPTVLERNDGVFVFYSSAVNSLVGESGSCKTWVALIAIEQELHLGHHVMLIDYEGDRQSIVNRLRELGITDDQMRGRFSYVQPDRKFTDTDQARVFEECIEERGVPSLVIIDGLTEAFAQAGLNPNEGVDVANYFAGAPKWFAHQGAAVVLIDHVTKNAESRNGYAIGSQHKKSAITGAMYVVEVVTAFGRSKTGRVKLTVTKDRGGYVDGLVASNHVFAMIELRSLLDGSITTSVEAPKSFDKSVPFRPTGIMEQTSKMIEAQPGIGSNDLGSLVHGNKAYKALALQLLVSGGFIEIVQVKNRGKSHTSLKPYREALEHADKGDDDDTF